MMETDNLVTNSGGSEGSQPMLTTAIAMIVRRDGSSKNFHHSLHQYARDGEENKIKDFIGNLKGHERKKIDDYDEDKQTPLHCAVFHNHLGVVKLLVEAGADVDATDEDNKTPLHHAAGGISAAAARDKKKLSVMRHTNAKQKGDDFSGTGRPSPHGNDVKGSIITYLVNRKALINSSDIYGRRPLHFAALSGNKEACRDLLRYKDRIQIDAPDNQGYTPLHMAVIHNRLKIVSMLLRAGADVMCQDKKMTTLLHLAATEGNVDLVQMLFDESAQIKEMMSAVDAESSTCLHRAIENGHYKVTELFLRNGSNVNESRRYGICPIHLASQSGNKNIVRLLINEGAFIDAFNDHRVTPLHLAIAFNHHEVAKLLIDRGADVNFQDKSNYTPLLLSVTYGNTEIMELLLKKGADYMATDAHDKTAIILACEENKYGTLKKLLSHGSVKTLVNDGDVFENSPLHIAAQEGHLNIVKVLLSNGASPDSKNLNKETPLHVAARFGHTNIVRELIKKYPSIVNYEGRNSTTALHVAAQYGNYNVVKMLLDREADFTARNNDQLTPLDLAALEGRTKTCNFLLSEGAPVDNSGEKKTTPLYLAASSGQANVVKLLLEWDADVTFQDDSGHNCLDRAIENNHQQVVLVIVNSAKWEDALRNVTKDPLTDYVDTPMRKLIRKMPDIAERVFERCVCHDYNKDLDYETVYNYEFLDDGYNTWIINGIKRLENPNSNEVRSSSDDARNAEPYTNDTYVLKKNHPLFVMVSSERENLLAHPFVTLLLAHKWNTYGRAFYYLSCFIYFIFLTCLTGYMVDSVPPHNFSEPDQQAIENNSCGDVTDRHSQNLFPEVATYVIYTLSVFNMLKELVQIYHVRLHYCSWTNLIEWIVYITSFLFVVNFNDCQRQTGFRYDWQWNLGVISVFLAWIELLLIIYTFPLIGIYVVMFTDILRTFIKFFLFAFSFIVAFALSFYALFQDEKPFSLVSTSLLKTFVMMIGEGIDDIINQENVHYKPAAYILWFLFLVIMSILLVNLLIGLAVDGIKGVKKQAALKRLAMQVELVLNIEKIMPKVVRRKQVLSHKTIRPNQVSKNPLIRFIKLSSAIDSKALHKAPNPELEGQYKLADVKKMEKSLMEMREQNQRLESMLRAIVIKQEIYWQEEDYQGADEKWRRTGMKPSKCIKQYYFQS